jgi:hypothetical protein
MTKRKKCKRQTTIYKTQHRKSKIAQQELTELVFKTFKIKNLVIVSLVCIHSL